MMPQGFLSNHGIRENYTGVVAAANDINITSGVPTTLNPPKTPVLDRIVWSNDAAAVLTIHTALGATPAVELDTLRLDGAGTIAMDVHMRGEPSKNIQVDISAGNGSVRTEFHLE